MLSTKSPSPNKSTQKLSYGTLSTILSHKVRWLILRELAKGQPLPVQELSKRVRASATSISKHMITLRQFGAVERGFGGLYTLPAGVASADGTTVDFGLVVIRVDRLE